jgi:IS30 family transposase
MRTQKRLTPYERERILIGLGLGQRPADLARLLGRHRSVVTREIARNTRGGRPYSAHAAGLAAAARASSRRGGRTKLASHPELWQFVREKLTLRWSPQQISAALADNYPFRSDMRISHEAIYHYLYVLPRGEVKKSMISLLRRSKPKRGRKTSQDELKGRIPDMIGIGERPHEVDGRLVPGHWEGDMIMGAGNRSAIGTLVERVTRYTLLVKLEFKDTDYTCMSFANAISNYPERLRRSMTYDQGKELSNHATFTGLSGAKVYFCDPRSPWQRGTNENTNGLLRQYFPKGTDLSVFSQDELDRIQDEFNGRPRKVLNWYSPKVVFNELVALNG